MENQHKRRFQIILICVLAVILLAMIAFVIWMEIHGKPSEGDSSTTPQASNDQTETPPNITNLAEIETPYGTLHYGDVFVEYLQTNIVETPVYQVQFLANIGPTPVPLFDICFGGETGNYLGYLEVDGETVDVYSVLYELKQTGDLADEDMIMLYSMQEQINQIIDHLPLKYHDEVQNITTPCGVLMFDENYSQWFRVEQKEQSFLFYAELDGKPKLHLFTLSFGDGDGDLAGTAVDAQGNSVKVYVQLSQLEFDEKWTESEKDTVFAMQEELNSMLDQLSVS